MMSQLRVLIVEDSEDDMLLMLRELRRGGYSLDYERVDTPAAMQAALDRQAWDIVIADYTLPAFSAPEALKLLQSRKLDLPFIIVSGTIGEGVAVAAMKAGAHDYIIKGNLTRLLPAVEREWSEAEERHKRHIAEQELRKSEERIVFQASELSRANDALQEYADELEELYNHAPCGYHSLDKDGVFIRINDTELKMLGYTRDEVVGKKNFSDVLSAESLQTFQENFRLFKQRGWVRDLEFQIIRKDGKILPVSLSATAMTDATGNYLMSRSVMIDISDRKQAEEDLKQSEQKFRAIFDSTFQFMGLLTTEGIVVEANRTALDAIAAELADVIGKPLWATPWWSHFPQQQEQLQQAIALAANGEFVRFESKHILADGTLAFVDFSLQPFFDAEGKVVMLIPEGRDISDRQQAEEELRESEARYRLLFESNPNPMLVFELETLAILAVNQAAIVHYGYSQAEFLSMTIADIRSFEDIPALHQTRSTLIPGQNYTGVWQHLTKDGRAIDVEIVAHTFSFVGKRASLVLVNDITERLQAEQKIREQAALLDITTDAICVRDLEHHILFWNKGAERLYGWDAAEVLGKNAIDLLYVDDERLWEFETIQTTLIKKGQWQGEFQKITKDGKTIIVESRWTLVRDQIGNPKSILTVSTDITEKKQLEAQFLRTQRLESLGTLASGIAHDFNNILTPILAAAQLLPLKLPNLDEQSQGLIKLMEDSSKRGADLVKQILTFARGAQGKRVPLQVRHLLSEVVQVARQTFPKTIEIYNDIPKTDLWTVSADATQLHQVLVNLCVNARDAMPEGGTLSLSAKNQLVDAAYTRMNLEACTGFYVAITVSDTGTGIAAELLDRIFDPFFTTKEQGKGTGLGLSTVIGIVKNHGGFVKVYSQVGKGSQFKVYLPASEDAVIPPVAELEVLKGNQELILIVDDEPLIQQVTQTALEAYNYRTVSANNGVEAIAVYAKHKDEISIVLMDMMMPSMDGLTALRTLHKLNPQVRVIATSGLALNTQLAEASGIGIEAFLSKPYTAKELLDSLQRVQSRNN